MEFINTLDLNKFRATNPYWNELCLNDPWSVGYVSSLIETQTFQSKEDWEQFYYDSGAERNSKINSNYYSEKTTLNNHILKKTNPEKINNLSWDLKNLNFQYGRTKSDIAEKGKILFDYVSEKGISISLEECIECVRFRTICETWNGIIVREQNTVNTLKQKFIKIDFVKTAGTFDHQYAVDYELKIFGKLICGIQIKPKSYLGNAPYLKKAQSANQQKNNAYFKIYGKPVFDVIAQSNGIIVNSEILEIIQNAINEI